MVEQLIIGVNRYPFHLVSLPRDGITSLKLNGLRLVMFVKPAVISSSTDITTVKFTDKDNHLLEKDFFFGEAVDNITKKMTRSSRQEFFSYAKDFLMKALAYMKDKFPFRDPVLQHARIIDPSQRHTAGMSDLLFFLQKLHGFNKSIVQTQFQLYLSYPLPASITNLNRVDSQWNQLMKFQESSGNCIFKELATAMLCLCSIPHSNAAAERAFSMVRKNRTSQRASLSTQSLEAILVTKFSGASTGQLSDGLLRKCKSATYKSLHN